MSIRKQVDQFLKAPKMHAAKALDHEGMLDEDHFGIMLKPGQSTVEVGKRRLGLDQLEMTGRAYEGKKVSRKQLVESSSESNPSESEESGHSESEESGFDEAMDRNAKIYDGIKDKNELDDDKELDLVLNNLKQQPSQAQKPS